MLPHLSFRETLPFGLWFPGLNPDPANAKGQDTKKAVGSRYES